ncbi:hypothetical protein [Pandoraea pnomenusa]|nr:hypothetical protein [Pandoraea pnomenusa]QDH59515.1 hypothetical protein FKQ53_09625 [Pandoraea pnomenusa]
MNTLNALQRQNNAPTQAPSEPVADQAPTASTSSPDISPLQTTAGFDCQALIAEEFAHDSNPDVVAARFRMAAVLWREVYSWTRNESADYVKARYKERAEAVADPQRANQRASYQCEMNALAARLMELGVSVAVPSPAKAGPTGKGADARAVTQAQQARMGQVIGASKAEESHSAGRKRKVLPQYSSCLSVVDVHGEPDVKNMYWYAIENTCGETLSAHWCEGKGCGKPTLAADIGPGSKETSWMRAASIADVRFRGTACASQYAGAVVQYDKQRNQCWVWEN